MIDDDGNFVDFGFVGEVIEVKVKFIKKEIVDGFVLVIFFVVEDDEGKFYNINVDVVVGCVVSVLCVWCFVYMSDVFGFFFCVV